MGSKGLSLPRIGGQGRDVRYWPEGLAQLANNAHADEEQHQTRHDAFPRRDEIGYGVQDASRVSLRGGREGENGQQSQHPEDTFEHTNYLSFSSEPFQRNAPGNRRVSVLYPSAYGVSTPFYQKALFVFQRRL